MHRLTNILMACVSLGFLGAQDGDVTKKAIAELQGEWQAVSINTSGVVIKGEQAAKVRMVFEGNRMFLPNRKDNIIRIKLDVSASPKGMDFYPEFGPSKGKKISGIYKLESGLLTICSYRGDVIDQPRPKNFKPKVGEKLAVTVLKRVTEK